MDFRLVNHGSICLLTPLTERAKDWVCKHLPEDAQRFGGATVIEPRYAGPIVDDIQYDGMTFT